MDAEPIIFLAVMTAIMGCAAGKLIVLRKQGQKNSRHELSLPDNSPAYDMDYEKAIAMCEAANISLKLELMEIVSLREMENAAEQQLNIKTNHSSRTNIPIFYS